MTGGPAAQDDAGDATHAHSPEAVYHIRVIHPWVVEAPAPASKDTNSDAPSFSFFGLELELTGYRHEGATRTPVSTPLRFGTAAHTSDIALLSGLVRPFLIRVTGKTPPQASASTGNKLVFQRFVAVQPGNFLLDINSVRFLQTCESGKQVHECLLRVTTTVSMAKPFELTFQRHNHAQAAAKIVPFATRADVQVAQVAQHKKMQEHEAQLTEAIRRKKQCVIQQIDYEQEQYLFDHIGRQLFDLHEEIMANGQWQAYEFEQALWYFHASTSRLYAGHPMRNSDKTRQLIGAVQLETRFAVRKLQRAARISLRRNALAFAAVTHPTLLEKIWSEVWELAWTRIREEAEEEEKKRVHSEPPVPTPVQLSDSLQEQQQQQLSKAPTKVVSPWKTLNAAAVAKHGIPAVAPTPTPAVAPSVVVEEKAIREPPSGPDSSLTDVGDAVPHVQSARQKAVDVSGPDCSLTAADAPHENETIQQPRATEPTVADLKQSEGVAAAAAAPSTIDRSYDSDGDDECSEWRGYLTLLKSNLKQKRSSPPKHHHHHRHHARDHSARNDAPPVSKVSVETQTHPIDDDVEDRNTVGRWLPRVHQAASPVATLTTVHHEVSVSSTKRGSSSIAPPRQGDVAPFMLQPRRAAGAHDSECVSRSALLSSHVDSLKVRSRCRNTHSLSLSLA